METIAKIATRSLHDQVCEEIRVWCARRKISQAEVARRAGWTPFYFSNRMTGKTPMNVNDLEALSRVLNVPVTAFFPTLDQVGGGQSVNDRYLTDPPVACGNTHRSVNSATSNMRVFPLFEMRTFAPSKALVA